jgi:hypothetical protein
MYTCTVKNERFQFQSIREILAKASEEKSGDKMARIAAQSYLERMAAKVVLSELTLKEIFENPVIPYEQDEVTRIIYDDINQYIYKEISHWSVGELRDYILSHKTKTSDLFRISKGLTSEMISGVSKLMAFMPYFDAIGSNTFYYGAEPGNSQVAKLVNNMILGVTMNAVAEGLKLGNHYGLPEEEILNLLKVSTGDSWVVKNWSDVSEWTADTALAVILKDLIATYNEGIKHNISMPFNALSSTQLFDSMGKDKPKA